MVGTAQPQAGDDDEYVLVTVDEYAQELLRGSAEYDISVRCSRAALAHRRAARPAGAATPPQLVPPARATCASQGLDTPTPTMRLGGHELTGQYEEDTTAMMFGARSALRSTHTTADRAPTRATSG